MSEVETRYASRVTSDGGSTRGRRELLALIP